MWILALYFLLVSPSQAADAFLKPEEAFRYTVRVADDQVTIRWQIEPGYYLYRNRMAIQSPLASVQVGDPRWPPGERHIDEFFGEQQIYRGVVMVAVPLTVNGGRTDPLPLELKLQAARMPDFVIHR
jgi:thiol:disulfide interchange protein DsbD